MRKFLVLLIPALLASTIAETQAAHSQHSEGQAASVDSTSVRAYRTAGTVKEIDETHGTVLIDHRPVKELNWSGIVMRFKVGEPGLLGALHLGQQVEIEFVKRGYDYVITTIR